MVVFWGRGRTWTWSDDPGTLPGMMTRRTWFLDQGETLGGAERFLLDFFNAVDLIGMEPTVFGANCTGYREGLPNTVTVREWEWPSVRGNKILASRRMLRCARELADAAKMESIEQIWANTPRTILVAVLARQFFKMPGRLVVMLHDFTIPAALLRWALGQADVIAVNSEPTRQYAKAALPKKRWDRIRLVWNGVDLTAVPKFEPIEKIKNVLILGRIDPRKGQLYAVRAFSKLVNTHPELRLRVVGSSFDGDDRTVSYEKEVHAAAEKLPNVEFISEVADPLREMMKADLVLALPTESETFGRIVPEALACGRLVLAFDWTGPADVLRWFSKESGQPIEHLLLPTDDFEALADRIGWWTAQDSHFSKFSADGQDFVKKNLDLQNTAAEMMSLLTD